MTSQRPRSVLRKSRLRFVLTTSLLAEKVIVGHQLLQEQNKYDQMPPDLLDRLQRILYFADKVVDDIVGDETAILERTIPEMFQVMQKVANFSCEYVKRGRFGRHSPFLDLSSADDSRENGGRISPRREDRRSGQGAGPGGRRIRACSERGDSLRRQKNWSVIDFSIGR